MTIRSERQTKQTTIRSATHSQSSGQRFPIHSERHVQGHCLLSPPAKRRTPSLLPGKTSACDLFRGRIVMSDVNWLFWIAIKATTELLHESLDEESWPALPQYRGWLDSSPAPQAVGPQLHADTTTVTMSSPVPPAIAKRSRRHQAPNLPRHSTLLLAMALVLLIALATTWRDRVDTDVTTPKNRVREVSAGQAPSEYVVAPVPEKMLRALGVADACLMHTRLASRSDEGRSGTSLVCCTYCHAADAPVSLRPDPLARLASACVACHDRSNGDGVSG